MKKFRKIISLLLSLALLCGLTGNVLAANPATWQLSELLGAGKIKALGRTEAGGSGILTDWSGSGFEINVTADGGEFTVGYTASYNVYWAILVDGEQVWRGQAAAGTGTFGTTIAAGSHTVSVIKETQISTDTSAYCDLTTVSFDGTVNAAPAEKELYIEFVGDSYSCGDGALGKYEPGVKWSSKDDSATHGFPWYTARLLNADYSIVARGGIGLLEGVSAQEGTTNTVTMADIYEYASGYRASAGAYGFTRQPDIVVVELGANDNISTDANASEWTDRIEIFLTMVRENNPGAAIVYLTHETKEYSIVKTLIGEGTIENLYTCHYAHNGNGSAALATQKEGHPSAADHQETAKALVAFLRANDLLPAEEAQTQYNDIVYYASSTGSSTNDGRTIETAVSSVQLALKQAKADKTDWSAADRLVIYVQGTVSVSATQIFAGGFAIRTADGKDVPIVITTYEYDGTNRAVLRHTYAPKNLAASATYAANSYIFKDVTLTSITGTDGYCVTNFYAAGHDVVFDNTVLTTDGNATKGATKWTVSADHFSTGGTNPVTLKKDCHSSVTFKNGDYTNLARVTAVNSSSIWQSSGSVTDVPYLHCALIIGDGAVMGNVYNRYGTMNVGSAQVILDGGTVANYYGTKSGSESTAVTYKGDVRFTMNSGLIAGSFYGTGSYITLNGDVNNTITGGEISVTPNGDSQGVFFGGWNGVTVNGNVNNTVSGGDINVWCNEGVVCGVWYGGRSGYVLNGNLTNRISGGNVAFIKGTGTPSGSTGIYFGMYSGRITGELRCEISGGTFDLSMVGKGAFYFGGQAVSTHIGSIVNVLGTEGSDGGPRFLGANVYLGGGWGRIGVTQTTTTYPTESSDTVIISNTIYGGYFNRTVYGGPNSGSSTYVSFVKGGIENKICGGKFLAYFYGGTNSMRVYGNVNSSIEGGIFACIYGGSGSGAIYGNVNTTVKDMREYYNTDAANGPDWRLRGGSNSGAISGDVTLTIDTEAVIQTPIVGGSNTGTIAGTAALIIKNGTLGDQNTSAYITNAGTTQIYAATFPSGVTLTNVTLADALAPGRFYRDADKKIVTPAADAASLTAYTTVSLGADLKTDGAQIKLTGVDSNIYDGTEKKPAKVEVTLNGSPLSEGTDYTLRYLRDGQDTTDLTGLGTVTVAASGTGTVYTGTVSTGYTITRDPAVAAEIQAVTNAVNGYSETTVKVDDSQAIQALVTRIDKLLTEQAAVLSEAEVASLNGLKTDCANLLTGIDTLKAEAKALTDAAAAYRIDQVTSADAADIEKLVQDIQAVLDAGRLDAQTNAGLETAKSTASALLSRIAEAKAAAGADSVKDITPDTVKAGDRQKLEAAVTALNKAKSDYAGNYTENEKTEIDNTLARLNNSLAAIRSAQAVETQINALPAEPTLADKDAVKAAEDAYDALTPNEKTMVSPETVTRLQRAVKTVNSLEADNPAAGDGAALLPAAALMLLSLAAAAALLTKRRFAR
ncbi:MAG: hypothetical protein J6L24_04280 [Oscillospiraceae bacterium]|nr:hypothetical protein [Oscillospiraceae bacterium]